MEVTIVIVGAFAVGALTGIGYAVSCVAQELKRANALKTIELKAKGVEIAG